ncbi:MAG: tetratricopeptide repeat protein [Edaphocola sp.]
MTIFIQNEVAAQQPHPPAAKAAPKVNVRPEVRKGNKLYKEQKYGEAQAAYLAALKKAPANYAGTFNLGDALYKEKNYEQARQALQASAGGTSDKSEKARSFHNIGNTYMAEKKWEDAIAAYKQALKLNPSDADTKYNLAYANAMLKKNGGGGGGNNNDKNKDKDKDDKNKDKDNKDDKNKENQDKNGQDKPDQNKDQGDKDKQGKGDEPKDQDQPPQHPQGQPSKLSEQQAENLLNALRQEEKKLQDKKEKGKAVPIKLDKDW